MSHKVPSRICEGDLMNSKIFSMLAMILSLGTGLSAKAQSQQTQQPPAQQAPQAPVQQGGVQQQQQQLPNLPPAIVLETFSNWHAELRRERSVVTQARAWVNSGDNREFSFGFIWSRESAPSNPTVYIRMPESQLRTLRDIVDQDRGIFIEVALKITEAGGTNPKYFTLRNFVFFGDTSIARAGSQIISTDLLQALWIATDPNVPSGTYIQNTAAIEVDLRVRDEDGRVQRIFQRSFNLHSSLRAILRAQEAVR